MSLRAAGWPELRHPQSKCESLAHHQHLPVDEALASWTSTAFPTWLKSSRQLLLSSTSSVYLATQMEPVF